MSTRMTKHADVFPIPFWLAYQNAAGFSIVPFHFVSRFPVPFWFFSHRQPWRNVDTRNCEPVSMWILQWKQNRTYIDFWVPTFVGKSETDIASPATSGCMLSLGNKFPSKRMDGHPSFLACMLTLVARPPFRWCWRCMVKITSKGGKFSRVLDMQPEKGWPYIHRFCLRI